MPDRRQSAATAATGYGLVAAGGSLRGGAIDDAHKTLGLERRLKPSSLAVLRARTAKAPGAASIVHRFGVGTGLVTVGGPAAALGTYNLLHRRKHVAKADIKHAPRNGMAACGKVTLSRQLARKTSQVNCPKCLAMMTVTKRRRSLVTEGVAGTGDAWRQKAESLRSGAPPRTRAIPIAVGAGGAGLASLAAHRGIDTLERAGHGVPGRTRAALTAVAAVPGTLATLPLSRRLTRRSGYRVGPTGTQKIRKADYPGRHVSATQQRARITAAGATPIVGPLMAARQADRYAPPGHKRGPLARQAAVTGTGTYFGIKVGQHAARHAEKSPGFARAMSSTYARAERAHGKLPSAVRRVTPLRPLSETGAKGAAALIGYKVASSVVNGPGTQAAISRDIAAERRYDRRQHEPVGKAYRVSKLVPGTEFSDKQRRQLIRRKKIGAAANVIGGTAGLTALGMLASKHPAAIERRAKITTVAAGIGGLNAFNSASIGRREAKAEKQQIAKSQKDGAMVGAGTVAAGTGLLAGGVPGVKEPDALNIWNIRGKVRGTPLIKPADHRNVESRFSRSNLAHNAKILAPQPRAGILGFRAAAHQAFIDDSKNKKHGNAYVKGMRAGKLESEEKIVRGMRTARRATYPLTIGGIGLAAAGRHRQRVGKAASDRAKRWGGEAVGAGLTTAAVGHGVPEVLDRYSRRYADSAKAHTVAAQRLAPHFGGLKTTPAKISDFGVMTHPARQTIYPERTDRELAADKSADRIRTAATRATVGRHRGIAAQERHFVEVFDSTSRAVRRARGPGLALAGAGAAGLLGARQRKVTKADSSDRYRQKYRDVDGILERFGERTGNPMVHMHSKTGVQNPRGSLGHLLAGKTVCGTEAGRHVTTKRAEVTCPECVSRLGKIAKGAPPIQTNLDDKTAHKLVHGPNGYGLKGPLPRGLDRDTRKTAYEARYVAAGGHKRQRWSHVADTGDRARNAGLAGGMVAGAAWLGAGSPRTRKLVAPLKSLKRFEHTNSEHVRHKAERAAVAAATLGAAGELTEEGAKRKRASYSSAPAGVAAGALRRMQNYTP